MYLRQQNRILARQDFGAEDDATARDAVALVLDACDGQCDSWELWDGSRLVSDDLALRLKSLEAGTQAAAEQFDKSLERLKEIAALAQEHAEEVAAFIEEGLLGQGDRLWRRTQFAERAKEIRAKQLRS